MTVALAEQLTNERNDSAFPSTKVIWNQLVNNQEKSNLLCSFMTMAIEALLNKNYSAFDAHTTSNCCHGIAVLVCEFSNKLYNYDLKLLQLQALHFTSKSFDEIPNEIFDLTSLYVLRKARSVDSQNRVKTSIKGIFENGQVGASFCWKLINKLQKHFSNGIVERYQYYLSCIPQQTTISGALAWDWGRYVQQEHIRTDKRGIRYASCIYTTQICLAYAIASGFNIGITSDLLDSQGNIKGRYVRLTKPDENGQLQPLSKDEVQNVRSTEPVLVFGGYTISDELTLQALSLKMEKWLYQIPNLILAGDLFYPQFPTVSDDPDFNNEPIVPQSAHLQKLLAAHAKIKGISSQDPSLFLSSHNFPASVHQFQEAYHGENTESIPHNYSNLSYVSSDVLGSAFL